MRVAKARVFRLRRITRMVQREGLVDKLDVRADGNGQVGHAGSALLAGVADRVGLTRALCAARGRSRQRAPALDPAGGHRGRRVAGGCGGRGGPTAGVWWAVAPTRQRASAHDPGVVLRDLAVMLADGGTCVADLAAQRDQVDLFGNVAADATAFRVIDSV